VHEVSGAPKAVHAQALGEAPGAVHDVTVVRCVGLSPEDERSGVAATWAAHRLAFPHSPKTDSRECNVLRASYASIVASKSVANLAAPCKWEMVYVRIWSVLTPHRVREACLHPNGRQSPTRCWLRPGFLYECSGPRTHFVTWKAPRARGSLRACVTLLCFPDLARLYCSL
jgi:hypothetical protein